MSSLPNPGYPEATRIAESLASFVSTLDSVTQQSRTTADDAITAHAQASALLADVVIGLIEMSPEYQPPGSVLSALGHPFAEGILLTAAIRAGLLSTRQDQPGSVVRMTETPRGRECAVISRIEAACVDDEPVRFGS